MIEGEITERDAIELLDLIESLGIEVYVDGGWGVDALLKHQTRRHLDLDIALPARDLPLLKRLLIVAGFVRIPTDDTWEHNFVVQDQRFRRIDVHSYLLDDQGNNAGGIAYEARHLTGAGAIGGRTVRCIPPEVMIEFHLGYPQDTGDFADVQAICTEFDLPLPDELSQFLVDESFLT